MRPDRDLPVRYFLVNKLGRILRSCSHLLRILSMTVARVDVSRMRLDNKDLLGWMLGTGE